MTKNDRFIDNLTGWIVFVIAAVTYLLTIEPTTSFWDCGEFITTAYRLQVGHPPGAPVFMIVGRFLSLFASPENVAMLINAMSAICSALTIMFLYWTITHLARKFFPEGELTSTQFFGIIGSGLVGALVYTFSDTFWFSAVEGEVYAFSSLLTAVVFWGILKWENVADEPHSNRWLILIAYIIGLSIGVHLLNLLAIPAIVFVYYFKKYETTRNGVILSTIISLIILSLIMYGIIPGVVKVASWFELVFVNSFGLPFNTGIIIYAITFIGLIVLGLQYTYKKRKVLLNTILLSFTVIMIGYSSFAIVVIRSAANPPMDQNSPDNVFSLLSYLNREQYGSRPLVFGQNYNTPLDEKNPYTEDKPYYIQKDGKYVVADRRQKPNYDSRYCVLFPRMWSPAPDHVAEYEKWGQVKGRNVSITNQQGQRENLKIPTFGENLKFFFSYQCIHMYARYFMWNFVGRQNDTQGHGDILNGNWISGINFIDSIRLGDQATLPDHMKNNKGRNAYYFLPLILGFLGAWFHFNRKKKDFIVVLLLFILTGIAIVVYLNQYPLQPRERDYAYAGSFYAFAIWIGLGILALIESFKNMPTIGAIGTVAICTIFVPGLMAVENWDDHDRSDRYTARDLGANYLETCDKNSVIFTNGDNDTFPLWYNQDVEGVRTDVRVCNLSYLQTDWYVDQMKRRNYDSDPLPIKFEHDQYVQGTNDVVYLMEDPRITGSVELVKALDFVRNPDPRTKLQQYDNMSYIPTKKLFIKVDKEAVIRNKAVPESLYDQIVDTIFINLSNKNYIVKDELMVLDMIANANWERALYFAVTVGRDKYLGLQDYFLMEGLAYRFSPIKTVNQGVQTGGVNSEKMYDNMMNKFKWGNMNDPKVYIDENNQRMMTNIRNNFNRLAESLILEGKKEKALQVLDRNMELIPAFAVPYDYFSQETARLYFEAGNIEKGTELIRNILKQQKDELSYLFNMSEKHLFLVDDVIQRNLYFMREMGLTSEKNGQTELTKEVIGSFNSFLELYN